ncbi:hypothetical protein AB0O00_08100, partial [Kitasatospora sp. NPDC093558]
LPGAGRLTVGPIAPADGARLFASVVGEERTRPDPGAVERIVAMTGNLPLGVRAAAEKLAARPLWTVGDFAARLADEKLRCEELSAAGFDASQLLERACDRLPGPERQALALLSRTGSGGFGLDEAAGLLAVDLRTAEGLLGVLLDHHLLEQTAEGFRVPELTRLTVRRQRFEAGKLRVLAGGATVRRALPVWAEPLSVTG